MWKHLLHASLQNSACIKNILSEYVHHTHMYTCTHTHTHTHACTYTHTQNYSVNNTNTHEVLTCIVTNIVVRVDDTDLIAFQHGVIPSFTKQRIMDDIVHHRCRHIIKHCCDLKVTHKNLVMKTWLKIECQCPANLFQKYNHNPSAIKTHWRMITHTDTDCHQITKK